MNTLVNPSPRDFINFEFRFNRDPESHQHNTQIRTRLVEQLISEQLNSYRNPIQKVNLYPVERAGKSGSEVFYLDFYLESYSHPKSFIAKFQDIPATNKEYQSALDAEFGSLCPTVRSSLDEGNNLGIIVYDLAKIPNHQEFRGFFLNIENSDENCALALRSVFNSINLRPNDQDSRYFLEDFSKYLNRRTKPIEKLEAFIKASREYSGIYQLANNIIDHLNKLKDNFNFKFTPYLVHGDLHARNLMLNSKHPSQTELIDFGWSHYGHPAKDFVLMEATLKYMLLSELLLSIKKERESPLHFSLEIYEKIEDFLCRHCFDLPSFKTLEQEVPEIQNLESYQVNSLKRVYICLVEVRKQAGNVLGLFVSAHSNIPSAEKNYFASLFLVVLGLSALSEMEPIWTLIGLDKIGKAIWHQP